MDKELRKERNKRYYEARRLKQEGVLKEASVLKIDEIKTPTEDKTLIIKTLDKHKIKTPSGMGEVRGGRILVRHGWYANTRGKSHFGLAPLKESKIPADKITYTWDYDTIRKMGNNMVFGRFHA